MPLKPCPECHRDISTRAASCPHCGCPQEDATTTTIQATGKRLKLQSALAAVLFIFGLIWFAADVGQTLEDPDAASGGTGLLLMLLAAGWAIIVRVRRWWAHD